MFCVRINIQIAAQLAVGEVCLDSVQRQVAGGESEWDMHVVEKDRIVHGDLCTRGVALRDLGADARAGDFDVGKRDHRPCALIEKAEGAVMNLKPVDRKLQRLARFWLGGLFRGLFRRFRRCLVRLGFFLLVR